MPSLMDIYRDLHSNPELSGEEVRTAAKLAAEARDKLVACAPLTAVEPDRRRVSAPTYDPLFLERLKFGDG